MQLQFLDEHKFLKVLNATELELKQLNTSLTKRIQNWRFHPLVKKGHWDGYISFFKNNQYIPAGLWKYIYDISKLYNFNIEIKDLEQSFNLDIKFDEFRDWVTDYFKDYKFQPRAYQIDAAFQIIKYKWSLNELATSAGKTLITFLVVAYLLDKDLVKKVLMIVPNISLVGQAVEDFEDYNQGKLPLRYQEIYAGKSILKKSNIVIGTYQSLVKKDKEFLSNFDCVICDEAHLGNNASIKTILEKCGSSKYRFGLTGTIPKDDTLENISLQSSLGPAITKISAKYLMDEGYISSIAISVIRMKYTEDKIIDAFHTIYKGSEDDRKRLYNLEHSYIQKSVLRLNFITDCILKCHNNSIVMFHHVEYGKLLYEMLKDKCTDHEIYYIDGSVDANTRDLFFNKMESGENKILVASFGTVSTGVSINKIHYVHLAESFKSDSLIRQTIGRGLRLHDEKGFLTLIDYVDDFNKFEDNRIIWKNYLYKHGEERLTIYDEQKFPYTIKTISLQ